MAWQQNLTSTDVIAIATIVYAITTVVYTIATVALWKVTRHSLEKTREHLQLTQRSLDRFVASTYGATMQKIVDNQRELISLALRSEKLQKMFMQSPPENRDLDAETRLYAMAMINHMLTCFEHVRFGLIPEDFTDPIKDDIRLTYQKVPAIQRRWKEMRDRLPKDFVHFIEG